MNKPILAQAIATYYNLPAGEPWLKHKKTCRGINPFMLGWLSAANGEQATACTYPDGSDARRFWLAGYHAFTGGNHAN